MPHDLTPGDGQDVLARFKEARERRDPDAMLELFAEDAEYRLDPFETSLHGALAIRDHWNRVAVEQTEVEFDAERIWVNGRTVLASWHAAHTSTASGARLRERGFCTIELDAADLIARMRAWPVRRIVARDVAPGNEEAASGHTEGQDGR